ncbi:MAG: AMP phosphorylase [Thaumarchaeota archaeon]|nr:AMP phosphorylase [Nitrososphaerota archaeon]
MVSFSVRTLGINSGKPIIVLTEDDAADLGVKGSSRVRVRSGREEITAIVNIATKMIQNGTVGVFDEVRRILKLQDGDRVDIEVAPFPSSLQFIRIKLIGRKLNYDEIHEIVKDVVEGNLREAEVASFVTTLHIQGLDLDEATSLTNAMVETGHRLKIKKRPVVDKHSIGGVPGDKTSLLLVPVLAAAGCIIPKSSSRAITSAAGTADKAEVLMNVNLGVDEMTEVVHKTNGCLVWGGSLELAPADDIFVQIEFPLSIDPLLLPSIMSKKCAASVDNLVIDIPTGRGTKIKTIGEADLLAKDFIELGRRVKIKTQCTVTNGEQPIGYTIGPALEAREALEILMGRKTVPEQIDKVCHIAGTLLEMVGKKNGTAIAAEILKSGKAEKKMREIIAEQGGDAKIRPEDIEIGERTFDLRSNNSGNLQWVDNNALVEVARAAGAPKDKEAGIVLHKKLGDRVKKGESLFTIYSASSRKIERAKKVVEEIRVCGVAEKGEMLIHSVKEIPVPKKAFILER